MKPKLRVFELLILIFLFGLSACKKEESLPTVVKGNVVINELLPKNSMHGADQDGQFDDWIELYNLSSQKLDISGYYLTDSKKDLTKWKFPEGTTIEKSGYLIVWADKDTTQTGLHTNFKLSASGETVVFLTPAQEVIDEVKFPEDSLELSFARIPNGTGSFVKSTPTFNAENK
jgi:hypothetical protein